MHAVCNRKTGLVVAAALTALSLTAGSAWGVNKCVDANGKATYTDRPCTGGAAASSVSVADATPGGSGGRVDSAAINDNLKALQGCAAGQAGSCLRRDLIEKKCQVDAKGFVVSNTPDCRAYREDRNRFRELEAQCRSGKRPLACATLACATGERDACERMNRASAEVQGGEDRRRESAVQKGPPSGTGWYMSQDWYRQADGRLTASVACNERTSIILIKKPAALHRIFTSVTGNSYFLSVDEAARKGCAAASH